MKKLLSPAVFCFCLLLLAIPALADDDSAVITAKQGFVMRWDQAVVKNLTTFETIKTKKIDSWGNWNILWDGWSVDAGFAYDAIGVNTGAILLGRKFGTLADYVPLQFPLLDKLTITIYPVGLYINNLTDHPEIEGCSGGAIISVKIKFG